METILIMANALAVAYKHDIARLDIQKDKHGDYFGRMWLYNDVNDYWDIYQDGTIMK